MLNGLAHVGEVRIQFCQAQAVVRVYPDKQLLVTSKDRVTQNDCAIFALDAKFGAVHAGVGSGDNGEIPILSKVTSRMTVDSRRQVVVGGR